METNNRSRMICKHIAALMGLKKDRHKNLLESPMGYIGFSITPAYKTRAEIRQYYPNTVIVWTLWERDMTIRAIKLDRLTFDEAPNRRDPKGLPAVTGRGLDDLSTCDVVCKYGE